MFIFVCVNDLKRNLQNHTIQTRTTNSIKYFHSIHKATNKRIPHAKSTLNTKIDQNKIDCSFILNKETGLLKGTTM